MPAGITERDGFFTVREPAWHGLGQVLGDYPTREEAQEIAHPWEPEPEPIYRKRVRVTHPVRADEEPVSFEYFEEVPGYVLNARTDDPDLLLGVVSETYTSVLNGEMWDIAEVIEGQDKSSVMYETAGSLDGGKKVWLLMRLRDPILVPGDPNGATIPYYALQNSHDAAGAFRGQATVQRIVCANTAQIADMDAQARGTEFNFRHTKNIRDRISQARMALAGWRDSIERWQRISEFLVNVQVTDQQAWDFIGNFIPMPPPHVTSPRVEHNVEEARAMLLDILRGETCAGVSNTAYGLVQASVEYLEHHRKARSAETRFKRAMLDRNTLVAEAQKLALEAAGR